MFDTGKGIVFAGVETKAEAIRIVGKVGFSGHRHLEHFKFLKAHYKVTPKMTIPAPSTMHFRQGRQNISKQAYPDMDAFFDDLAKAYQKAIRAFYDAGCRYLQMDDTAWSMMCDPEGTRAFARARRRSGQAAADLRGDDQQGAGGQAGRHDDHHAFVPRQLPLHLHRLGRLRVRRGAVARHTNLDGYFLEYDTDRSGGFEPLRFVPKGKKSVVLGLVTSKSGKLESKDSIKRRIDEATKYVALDQLCLSPQCGFASTEEGNVLAEDEQWAKLRMIVELAEEVWGK